MNKGEVLSKSADLLSGDREADYGDAVENHTRIAALWSAYLGFEMQPWQVAVCMALMKVSRLANQPAHEDSHVDAAAYLAIAAEAATRGLDDGGPLEPGATPVVVQNQPSYLGDCSPGRTYRDLHGNTYTYQDSYGAFYGGYWECRTVADSSSVRVPAWGSQERLKWDALHGPYTEVVDEAQDPVRDRRNIAQQQQQFQGRSNA